MYDKPETSVLLDIWLLTGEVYERERESKPLNILFQTNDLAIKQDTSSLVK